MKKTFVDLSYFLFSIKEDNDVLKICRSTVGYIEEMTAVFDCHFVARVKTSSNKFNCKNLKVFLLNGKELQKWQIPFHFNWYIKSLNPDFILVHGFGYAHYLIFLKLICPKAKIILQCNGFAKRPYGFKKWIYKISDFFIDGYLFTGIENAKEWYDINIFKKEKVFEVMEGSTIFKINTQITRIENSYLWVGNLISRKDPLTILKAFNKFIDFEPSAKLTMIYSSTDLLVDVKGFISKHKNLIKSVELLGTVPNDCLEQVYNQHQFFILGSQNEGSGYALVESMACGCVPIVTSIAPHRYMTDNGQCALLFSPGNEEELLGQLIHSQEIDYLHFQNLVIKQFENRLSFKSIANKIQDVFQSL